MPNPNDIEIPQPVASGATDHPLPDSQGQQDSQDQSSYIHTAQDASGKQYGTTDGVNWVDVQTKQPYVPSGSQSGSQSAQSAQAPSNKPFTPEHFARDANGKTYALDHDGQWVDVNTRQPYKVTQPQGDYLSKTEDMIHSGAAYVGNTAS